MIDPEKQYLPEDESDYVAPPNFDEEEEVVDVSSETSSSMDVKDFTQYSLVATKAKNGIVLLWEWMPKDEARSFAQQIFEDL